VKTNQKEFTQDVSQFPFHKKLLHHARYTRPNWYKRYHSVPFVHYLHFAVLIIFAAIVGVTIFDSLFTQPQQYSPVLAATAPPRILSFQGRLTDNNDNPITTATSVKFAIYNVSTSGTALWEETQDITTDQDGIFNAILG